MTAARRWLILCLGTALLVGVPVGWHARPAADSDLTAADLVDLVNRSGDVSFSGYAESTGNLALPVTDEFSEFGDLLGGTTRMRVWWHDPDDWRVDSLRATGETDLVHQAGVTTTWEYEAFRATIAVDPRIRLPRTSDLLPSDLGRRLLTDATPAEVTRIDPARVAGLDAAGLRLRPAQRQSSIDYADVWVDPASGLAVRVEVYGRDSGGPALQSSFEDLTIGPPPAAPLAFQPPATAEYRTEDAIDIAAAADQFAPVIPPDELAGLARQRSAVPGAVGDYGRGATRMLAIPLWEEAASTLRDQLAGAAEVVVDRAGTSVIVGPLGILLTRDRFGQASWLLTGTVTQRTLRAAAHELAIHTPRLRGL